MPTLPLKKLLIETLKRHDIRDESLLVAVSGGADSVSLLLLLHDLREELQLQLSVAHFDHQLRESSADDAKWVEALCNQLAVPCVIGRPDQDSESMQQGGIEESARKRRYHFFQQVAERHKINWVAIAHTADDQAETVLHHIARGTGLKGLQGIPETRELTESVTLIRPLLQVNRSELIAELASRQQAFLQDESNTDFSFTRNRIRHDVLPYLKESLNPQIDQALRRLAKQAQEAQSAIDELARNLLDQSLTNSESLRDGLAFVRLSIPEMKKQPVAVVSAMFLKLWTEKKWPRKQMSHFHWSQLTEMATTKSPQGLALPGGIQATCRRDVLEIRLRSD
ncbi:tRNA lysidine(34) synthetase TilS [Thalassoglobus polymorphus]|uniref:tRNA lysidine(34) synthetase TilS n=1 Tax=Thalassoglobus polymorphus TaxID=2527994 RepID=UPI00119D2372|nr:tRNA lysidine(34) synthetase TilS [Thalassoglobus polymorphus]